MVVARFPLVVLAQNRGTPRFEAHAPGWLGFGTTAALGGLCSCHLLHGVLFRQRVTTPLPPARRIETRPRHTGTYPSLEAIAQSSEGVPDEAGHVHLRDTDPLGDLSLSQILVEPEVEDLDVSLVEIL